MVAVVGYEESKSNNFDNAFCLCLVVIVFFQFIFVDILLSSSEVETPHILHSRRTPWMKIFIR